MGARAAAIATLLLLLPRAAFAAEADDLQRSSLSGVRAGVQTGFGIPIGRTFAGSGALGETVSGVVPFRADLGARMAGGHFYVGGLVEHGILIPNACPAGAQCSGTRIRLGLTAAYHFLPKRIADPWIGAAFAYESISTSRAGDSTAMEMSAGGIDLPALELGVDLRPNRWLRLGPVVSGAMGRYTTLRLNETSTRDFDPAWHAWLSIGLRTVADF